MREIDSIPMNAHMQVGYLIRQDSTRNAYEHINVYARDVDRHCPVGWLLICPPARAHDTQFETCHNCRSPREFRKSRQTKRIAFCLQDEACSGMRRDQRIMGRHPILDSQRSSHIDDY